MLVVDLMHEFELGVWKALFIHLLRLLFAIDPSLLNKLDHRCVLTSFESRQLFKWFKVIDRYPRSGGG